MGFKISCLFCVFFVLSFLTYGQKDANKLREILKPYFIPVVFDKNFQKQNTLKIQLGKKLFYEKRISSKGVSCNSCHDLKNYGTNGGFYLSQKENGNFYRDVPSVYNISALAMYNSDGSVTAIEKKIEESLLSFHEMGNGNQTSFERLLQNIGVYKKLFLEVFPNSSKPVSLQNTVNALKTFLRELKTPAPIDDFISGENNALTASQIEGGFVFNAMNCYTCHTGSNLGGQMVQKLGITKEWPNQEDLGYYNSNRNPDYKMFFRVAPLRNVEHTAPYFHDASSKKIWKAIQRMGVHERGIEISVPEAVKIREFLKSLSGDIPYEYIKE